MNHPVSIKAEKLISAGDVVGAERALVALVDSEGDHALTAVLEDFPAKDLLAVMRDFDSSRESIIGLLVTPEQFARAIVLERRYADANHERLRGMISSVVFRAGGAPVEFLAAISDIDGGCDTLADFLGDRLENIEHFFRSGGFDFFDEGDHSLAELDDSERLDALSDHEINRPIVSHSEVTDHDWMELTWLLRYELPEVFREVLLILRARAKAIESADAEPGPGPGPDLDHELVPPVEADEESAL